MTPPDASGLELLQRRLATFRDERDWRQFHTLKNLSAAIAVEAAELQELFLWAGPNAEAEVLTQRGPEIEDEVADILIQLLNFVAIADIDLVASAEAKIDKNAARYPVDGSRGNADKASG